MHVAGHWIIELGELAALGKADITKVRSYLSRNEDVYRPPYGRSIVHRPRQCVFIATSNEPEPLKDAAGNRRFWPVTVGTIDTDALARDRDQIWAEVVEMYRSGMKWWFTDPSIIEESIAEQASRMELHVWHDPVSIWCQDREAVTVVEVLQNALKKDPSHWTQTDKVSVVRCLQGMGWKQTQRRVGGRNTKVYLNPEMLCSES